MNNSERDTHFLDFAKASWRDIRTTLNFVTDTGEEYFDEQVIAILAQHDYDLMKHACMAINNAQMKQGGVCLHPNAMLRAIPDLTELPIPDQP